MYEDNLEWCHAKHSHCRGIISHSFLKNSSNVKCWLLLTCQEITSAPYQTVSKICFWYENPIECEIVTAIADRNQLESLDVSNNDLVDLPSALGHCFHLKHLALSHNHIVAIPTELWKCKMVQFTRPWLCLELELANLYSLSHLISTTTKCSRYLQELGNCRTCKNCDLQEIILQHYLLLSETCLGCR